MISFTLKNFRISLTFGFFFVSAITTLSEDRLGALALLFCLIHELGHLIAMKILGAKVEEIKLYGAGISIKSGGVSLLSPIKQAAIYLAGPAANLFSAMVLKGAPSAINLCLAGFNLLPISYFDGGRLLSLIFYKNERALRAVSAAFSAIIASAAIFGAAYLGRIEGPSRLFSLGFIALSYLLDC